MTREAVVTHGGAAHGGAALGIVALATALLFLPAFEGRWFEWDVPEQYWPDLVYLCSSLHDGELPLWNPYDRAGYPYYADPQAGTYHPLHWAMCALGPRPGLGWMTLRVALGFFLAGAFGLLWLRRLRVPWSGALVGAIVIEAAPFMRHNWELNLTLALAHLPLILWATDRAVVERRAADGVVLGWSVALCAWVGSPPALWLSLTFAALYALARLVGEVRAAGRGALWPAIGALAIGAIVAAGLTAAVIVPGLALAERSVQAGRDYASIAAEGLSPDRLVALAWPQPGNHLYVGLVPLALAGVALATRRPLAMWMLAVAVIAVLLAMGDHGPLFRLAFEWVPGVDRFRLPYRYEAWLGPAAGALAALGMGRLAQRAEATPPRSARPLAVVAALAGVPLAFALPAPSIGLACLAAAALLWALAERRVGSVSIGACLALLVLADVSTALPPDRHLRGGAPPGDDATAARVFAEAPGEDRVVDEFAISCRAGTRHARRELRGYQDPLTLRAFERVLASLRETPALAEQYGVRYALQGPHFLHGWDRHFLPPPAALRAQPGAVARAHGVTELTRALPSAYWVDAGSVEHAADRAAALERVRALAPAPIAILDGVTEGSPRTGAGALPASVLAATDVVIGRDRVALSIDAPQGGVVVVNEAFYPGWEARVDGAPAPIYRANALVRAIPVSAGAHRVTMEFAPRDGAPLRWLLLVTLIASALAFALLRRPSAR
ncbi:MAG: hypothetical protein KF729_28505 [Sandaracinaceae bacterium]|nr:hypothetical protein [Sandaracinaceae bacterium]